MDILTYKVTEWMDLESGKVLGSGCILDTSRLVRSVSDYLHVSTDSVKGYVVGGHGDGIVPLWSNLTVNQMHIADYCSQVDISWSDEVRDKISMNVRDLGAYIIKMKGKTNFGIAICVVRLADAILNDRRIVASVTSRINGLYGCKDVALSLLSEIGAESVIQQMEVDIDKCERTQLLYAAAQERARIQGLDFGK